MPSLHSKRGHAPPDEDLLGQGRRRSRRLRRLQPLFQPLYQPLQPSIRRRGGLGGPKGSPIDILPAEMLMDVFDFLDMEGLITVSMVSRRFRWAVLNCSVWRGRSLVYEGDGCPDGSDSGDSGDNMQTVLKVLGLAPCLDTLSLRRAPVCIGGPLLQGALRAVRTLRVSDHELSTDNLARVLRRFVQSLQNLDLKIKVYFMSQRTVLELWESLNQMKRLRSLRLAGYLPCRLSYTFPAREPHDQTLVALDLHDFETDHTTTMLSLVAAHASTIARLTLPDSLSEDEVRRVLDTLKVAEDIDMSIGGHIAHLNGLPVRRLTLRHKNEACSAHFLEHVGECNALADVEELTVSWADGDLRDPVLSALGAQCSDLKVLRLHNMCDDRAPALIETVKEFTQIRELELNKFYPLDVQFVDELAMGALPSLRRLSLTDVLIGVPHSNSTSCHARPCYEHHFDRLSSHRKNLHYVFLDWPECWHRYSTITHTLTCYCETCMDFYGYMTKYYNDGMLPAFWK